LVSKECSHPKTHDSAGRAEKKVVGKKKKVQRNEKPWRGSKKLAQLFLLGTRRTTTRGEKRGWGGAGDCPQKRTADLTKTGRRVKQPITAGKEVGKGKSSPKSKNHENQSEKHANRVHRKPVREGDPRRE